MFTSIAEVDTVRSATYKYFNTLISVSSFTVPSVLVILREAVHGNLPGRAISNVEEVRQFFNHNSELYLYLERKLELMKPSEQITTLAKTDIFIGALGSGFANVIYMLPGSVVISYSPPHVGGFFFDTLCEMSRVHYIGVYNSSTSFPPECKNRINANGESTIRACLDVLYAGDIFVNIEQLRYLLTSAIIHLKSEKYRGV